MRGTCSAGSKAQRKKLSFAHDPLFAVSMSGVRALPHQIEAIYRQMLPQPRLRFVLADHRTATHKRHPLPAASTPPGTQKTPAAPAVADTARMSLPNVKMHCGEV